MDKLLGFAKLTKMDETKREVWGVLAEERVDKDGEIMDYASSKTFFQAWSDGFAKATDGKSLGNLRSMHTKVAAGKLIHMELRDDTKEVYIGAKVIDDGEWQKCKEAVYTGFSIGGDYEKVWKDASGNRRYTAKPFEASLVDNPCAYGATFEYVKMNGSSEMRKFKTSNEDNKMELKKGLCEVVDLTCLLGQLNQIRERCQIEAQIEGDNSAVPAQLTQAVDGLSAILNTMVAEETAEMTADAKETPELAQEDPISDIDPMEMSIKTPVEKAAGEPAPAEIEKAPLEKAVFEGRMTGLEKLIGDNQAETQKLQKALADQNESLTKMILERDNRMAELNGDLINLNKAIQEMTKRLIPAKTVLKGVVVEKQTDGLNKSVASTGDPVVDLIKNIHQQV